MVITTNSAQETKTLARKMAKKYHGGALFTLSGPLGAGKTTFAQGLAQGLGIKQRITSPTFILMHQYPIPGNSQGLFVHLDLYRLEKESQIQGLGLDEIFQNPANVILIEWPERLDKKFLKNEVSIKIKPLSKTQRQISIS